MALNLGMMYSFHYHQAVVCRRATTILISGNLYNATMSGNDAISRFSPTISKLLAGATSMDLGRFVDIMPPGFPLNGNRMIPTNRSKQVLLLYATTLSLPYSNPGIIWWPGSTSAETVKAHDMVRNCAVVKQIVLNVNLGNTPASARSRQSCVAVVGRGRTAESYHIQKWLRERLGKGRQEKVNETRREELTAVGRYQFIDIDDPNRNFGMRIVPQKWSKVQSRLELQRYFAAVDSALQALRPLADSAARAGNHKVQGTVIVLAANYGHSPLLCNYVCAARAVGVDTSKILLFASDRQTLAVGNSLGIATFYHEELFAGIPENASKTYGDPLYSKIMMSKAYCVHLVSQLGYNVLFQDVDIVPYQANILEWWVEKASSGYDLYFQFDFNGRPNYSPW
jgi:hypothetical protein